MNAQFGLQKLLTWLSPAFPVGSFAWSAGLETAIAAGRVHDAESTKSWIVASLGHGSLKTDAVLVAEAYRSFDQAEVLQELADLCIALCPSKERVAEMVTTGSAFVTAARAWRSEVYERIPQQCPYPVSVGAIAAAHDIALGDTLLAYLTAAVHTQVSVAVRLVPIGQTAGLGIMAQLEPVVAGLAEAAAKSTLAEIGAIAYGSDIAQMRHETLEPRIFRS